MFFNKEKVVLFIVLKTKNDIHFKTVFFIKVTLILKSRK